MKKYFCFVLFTVAILFSTRGQQTQSAEPLAGVATRVLKEGKDSGMNGGFAKFLGLTETGERVPMKRMIVQNESVTNNFYVSLQDKKTIVISERNGAMGTFYLTDVSGILKRAVVNDGNIKEGGLTNIPTAQAKAGFQKKKDWWIQNYSDSGK